MTSHDLLDTVATAALETAGRADIRRPESDGDLLTQNEAAEERRKSVRTLERERAEGRGPPYVQDGGRIFYRRGDIRKYIEKRVRGSELRTAAEPRRGRPRKQPETAATTPA
jgi:hypothetical protein